MGVEAVEPGAGSSKICEYGYRWVEPVLFFLFTPVVDVPADAIVAVVVGDIDDIDDAAVFVVKLMKTELK